jgi:chorismate-pyruvate lyase
MMRSSPREVVTLADLYRPFPDGRDQPATWRIEATELPKPYRTLLAHTNHMTTTVEAYYGEPVDVQVLASRRVGDTYARKIVLRLRGSGRAVQFAVTRIDLAMLSAVVRDAVVAEQIPLGRVLVQHGVLRTVRPTAYFVAEPTPALGDCLGLRAPHALYGRLGVLTVDGRPAIDVAEILGPVA